jgi:riboflavin biosynthesis pyrimidine reductase
VTFASRRAKSRNQNSADHLSAKEKNVMTRPRVICHMMASLDGRIVTEGWPLSPEERRVYEQVHATYDADGWLCGRVTMAQHFAAGMRSEDAVTKEYDGPAREDFVAPGEHASLAFAVDPHGRLVWESGEVAGDHVVALLTERVDDDYLATLRSRGVSYLIAGRTELDLVAILGKIMARFGVQTLMLEGGGGINGSLLQAGLVDEVSVLIAPVADGRVDTPSLFDVSSKDFGPRRLALEHVERREGDMLWLRYRVPTS